MDFEFVKEKWMDQKNYNSKKSKFYKNWYLGLEVPCVILGIITPIIIPFTKDCTLIPVITSGLAAVLKGISSFFGFHKKWVNCRNLTEAYKIEELNYKAGIKGYSGLNDEQKRNKFANSVSDIITLGNSQWLESEEKKIEEENKKEDNTN